MKLPFDENLPQSMVRRLADLSPDSAHVATLGLESTDDLGVWTFAKEHGFAIVGIGIMGRWRPGPRCQPLT